MVGVTRLDHYATPLIHLSLSRVLCRLRLRHTASPPQFRFVTYVAFTLKSLLEDRVQFGS
jgi:hypothetical protein